MSAYRAGDLLPARILNEFAYCPRLAYLEWVQGEWARNSDTLEGEFVHRRVDQPQANEILPPDSASSEISPGELFHARSVRLENPELGLVAVVDLLEVQGPIATPIDYKKGVAPAIPEGAWEPERVQLCAQGLLLRHAGYTCDHGIIWFSGSRKRVTIPFDDALITRTRELITLCRQTADAGRMPLPLVDSPKCPRCSLVGICLPDETNFLLHRTKQSPGSAPTTDKPRLLLTPRPETVPLHVVEPGAKVGKRGDRLVIERHEEILSEVRLKDIATLCLYGPIQVSTQLVAELMEREIPICYFTTGGWFHGITHGLPHKNIELRIRQYDIAGNPQSALVPARQFVAGKIRNARTLIRRNGDSDELLLDALADAAVAAEQAESLESLLGIEGMAAKRYFVGLAAILKKERGFSFEGRNRRPPTDPVNAVLSFLYALLAREATTALFAAGLDPFLGFLHQPRYGRPALALDLAEEFRPLLADSVMISLFNTGEIKHEHFVARGGAVALKPPGKRAVLSAWERRLLTEVTHPIFGYTISYRRIIQVQARLLARVLLGEMSGYSPFRTR